MVTRSVITGCGTYLPEQVVTNLDMASRVDTSDEWIQQRTGIRERRIAAEGEKTSDLAIAAAEQALSSAGIEGSEIDLVVLATATPDDTFPATATRVQQAIGMRGGAAFDIQAVCSGFVYALNVADNFIRVGQARNILVIGAETFSRILDWNDRTTCVLFGDGAGAVVLSAAEGTDLRRTGVSSRRDSTRTEAIAIFSMWMEVPHRRAPSAIFVCRDPRSSNMPLPIWLRFWRKSWRKPV